MVFCHSGPNELKHVEACKSKQTSQNKKQKKPLASVLDTFMSPVKAIFALGLSQSASLQMGKMLYIVLEISIIHFL